LSPLFSLFVIVPGQGSLLFSLKLLLLLCDQLRLKRLWQARCSKQSGGEQQLKFELVGVFTPMASERQDKNHPRTPLLSSTLNPSFFYLAVSVHLASRYGWL
jgi:hypothetical protein